MIKLTNVFENIVSEEKSTIKKRKDWTYKISLAEEKKYLKKFDEKMQHQIKNEIEQEIKNEELINLNIAKKKSIDTGEEVSPWPVDVEAIKLEVLKKYENIAPSSNSIPDSGELSNKLMKVIDVFTKRGISEIKVKELINELRNKPGGHNIISSLYYYVENSPVNNIKDIIGQEISYDKLLEIINSVTDKASEQVMADLEHEFFESTSISSVNESISKFELKDLFDIDRGRPFITLLFSDVKHPGGKVNLLLVDGDKKLTIKNKDFRLISSNDQSGPAFGEAISNGFNELKTKYNLNIYIPSGDGEYNINNKKKSWAVDKIAWEMNGKVPREEVNEVLITAFKKLHPTQAKFDLLSRIVIPLIGSGKTFSYDTFIDNYFLYSLREYIAANNVSYIFFLNNELEKIYILDCNNVTQVANIKNKLDIKIPMFSEKSLLMGWVFGAALK